MNIETQYILLFMLYAKIVIAIMILPIIVAFTRLKKLSHPLRIFLLCIITDFLIGLLSQTFIWATGAFKGYFLPLLHKWRLHDTNFISIINYLSTFFLLGWYYSNVFSSIRIQRIVKFVSASLFVVAIIENLYLSDFRDFNSFNATTYAVFCMVLPLIHLWFVFNTITELSLRKNTYFWIDIGLLVPNVIGLFLHFTGNKLYETDMILYFKLSIAKYYFVMLAQIIYAVGFYYARYTKYLPEKW
jgi:hypothetical protein